MLLRRRADDLNSNSAGELCTTEFLTDLQTSLGTLSISSIGQIIPKIISGSDAIPQNVTCSDCSKQAFNIVQQSFPDLLSNSGVSSSIGTACGSAFTSRFQMHTLSLLPSWTALCLCRWCDPNRSLTICKHSLSGHKFESIEWNSISTFRGLFRRDSCIHSRRCILCFRCACLISKQHQLYIVTGSIATVLQDNITYMQHLRLHAALFLCYGTFLTALFDSCNCYIYLLYLNKLKSEQSDISTEFGRLTKSSYTSRVPSLDCTVTFASLPTLRL